MAEQGDEQRDQGDQKRDQGDEQRDQGDQKRDQGDQQPDQGAERGEGRRQRGDQRRERDQGDKSQSDLRDVIRQVTEQLQDLIDRPVEGVVSAQRSDDGWTLVVQVCELERVPNTMDVLANYEVETSSRGALQGYQRVLRYSRAQIEER